MKSKLQTLASEPKLLFSRLNRVAHGANSRFHERFVPKRGVDLMERDWDNLFILDACRFDEFEALSEFDGELERIRSLASTSGEWYRENVGSEDYFDTVCVTANPHSEPYLDRFHASESLYTEEYWDDDLSTVPPDVVAAAARRMAEEYPDKRLFVHFMQPHFPPIGETRAELPYSGNPPDGVETDGSHLGLQTHLRGRVDGVTEATALRAYRENLRIVLDVVEDFAEDLSGKTVLSSDHGELFGERLWPLPVRGILHIGHVRVDPLVEVPWHVLPFSDRRTVRVDPPVEQSGSVDSDELESRLRDLGYR